MTAGKENKLCSQIARFVHNNDQSTDGVLKGRQLDDLVVMKYSNSYMLRVRRRSIRIEKKHSLVLFA